MKTWEQFLSESAQHGGVNPIFESGMYSLVNDLDRLVRLLTDAGVQYEVVDGVAVNAHIVSLHRSRSFLTRDIDVLLHRNDLERVAKAAGLAGYLAKKMMGGFLLIRPGQDVAEAVHILFAGERSKSTQPLPHPAIQPVNRELFGVALPVAPLQDLLVMKLNSLRPKDIVHLETLDELRLITPAMEASLPDVLRDRLTEARALIAASKPDVDDSPDSTIA